METIIGVLVAVFILIFKVIEKKMSDSAQPQSKPQPAQRTLEEIFPIFELVEQEEEQEAYSVTEEMPEEAAPSVKVAEPFYEPAAPKIEVKEETPKEKEKIDPKKLVVYSEILNRKY